MRETWVPSLGWEDPLEKGKATHSSSLAWRIPWTEEPGGLQSIGLQRVRHDWSDLAHTLLVYSCNLDIITNNAYFDFLKCLSLNKNMYQPTCDMSLVTIIYLFHFIFFCGRRVYLRQQKEPLIIYAHFICILKPAAAAAKSLQLCPTLCDPREGSPPGSPVPRILQARILEWVAISFSNAWKWKWSRSVMSDPSLPHGLQPTRLLRPWYFPGKSTGVGCHCLLHWGTREAPQTHVF